MQLRMAVHSPAPLRERGRHDRDVDPMNAPSPSRGRARTSDLDVAYEVAGPDDGYPVVLVHGWPDDVRTWDALLPALHEAGYRTFAPWLRGFGDTRFLRSDTPRSGQLVALGRDLVEFTDAIGLARHALVGHDWGARAVYIASALDATRIAACAGLSVGYDTNARDQPLSYRQLQSYWYHWLMATPLGEARLRQDPRGFARHLWAEWFVAYAPDAAEFERTAVAFDNPDWVEVTLHSYRVRWGHGDGDPRHASLEAQLNPAPRIGVPTLTLHGDADPVNEPRTSEGKERFFTGPYERDLVAGAGHFPQRERPAATSTRLLDWLARHR